MEVGAGAELTGDVAGEGAEIDAVGADDEGARVQLREVEEVGRQLRQPPDLLAHGADELLPLLRARILFLEQLDEAAEAEDRRSKLVRCICDELLTGAVELGQATLHFIEGPGQPPELPGEVDRDPAAEVAVGDPPCRLLDPVDPATGDLGVVVADCEGDHEPEEAADPDSVAGAVVAFDDDDPEIDDCGAAEPDPERYPGDPAAELGRPQDPHSLNRYPTPRTVNRNSGSFGSASSFSRR